MLDMRGWATSLPCSIDGMQVRARVCTKFSIISIRHTYRDTDVACARPCVAPRARAGRAGAAGGGARFDNGVEQ
eukprot:SAG31_NODE_338_length_17490_cov_7.707032_16_plen_74_part_00